MDNRIWMVLFVAIAIGLFIRQDMSEESLQVAPYEPYKKYCQLLKKDEIRVIFRSKYQVRQFVSSCREESRRIATIDIVNLQAVAFQINKLQESLPQLITFDHRFISWWKQPIGSTLVMIIDVSKGRELYAEGVIQSTKKWAASQTIKMGVAIAFVQPDNKQDWILLNQEGTIVGQDIAIKSEKYKKSNPIINNYLRLLSSELFSQDHNATRIWKQLERLKRPYQESFQSLEKQVKKDTSKMNITNKGVISFSYQKFPKEANLSALRKEDTAYYFISAELEMMWLLSSSSVQISWRRLMDIQIKEQSKRYNSRIQSRVKLTKNLSQTKKKEKENSNSETESINKKKRKIQKQIRRGGEKPKAKRDDLEQN